MLVWALENQNGDSVFEGVFFHKYNKEYFNQFYLIYNINQYNKSDSRKYTY